MNKTKTRRRLSVALASTVLALFAGESALRLIYPVLPSLAALEDADLRLEMFRWSDFPHMKARRVLSDVCFGRGFPVPGDARPPATLGSGAGAPLRVWVVGDSVTRGFGVGEGKDYSSLLARRLARQRGRPVQLSNLAVDGAGFCEGLQRLSGELERKPAPDLVLYQLFSDDLEDRAMVSVNDRLVAFPDRVGNPALRAAVQHLYSANLAWVALLSQRQQRPWRFIDGRSRQLFGQSMAALARDLGRRGVVLVTLLLAPAGLHLCPAQPREDSRCSWLGHDQDLLAGLLTEADVPFVDLRGLWGGRPNMVIKRELAAMERGSLGIHPNEAGHALLAEVLWPTLAEALAVGGR